MFKDIIVGVTTTGVDACAVSAAVEFTKRFEAKLYLVHVAGMEQGWGSIETLAASGETERLRDQVMERYGGVLEGLDQAQVHVFAGIPHNELLRFARKKNADLIVMGPHTKEFEEKRSKMWGMAGSTLERVSQLARCPVMIVRKDVACKDPFFEHLLVATDFSDQAECAVNYGGQMCRHYKSGLTLMHVVDPEAYMADEETPLESLLTLKCNEAHDQMMGAYGERLNGIAACGYEVCQGRPSVEILKMAAERKADLIVMAHHSKEKDPEKAFLGSTVTQVALNAPCPTMSVNRHFDLRCGMLYDQSGGVAQPEAAHA